MVGGPTNFREVIANSFERRVMRNPRYSLRAFAKYLDIDVASLSKILNGKRTIGLRLSKRLGAKLGLEPSEVDFYYKKSRCGYKPQKSDQKEYEQVAEDHFKIISDWHHFAILELISTKDFKPQINWISKRLQISPTAVSMAIKRLQSLGMVKVEGLNLVDDTSGFQSCLPKSRSTLAYKNHQLQLLDKAKSALELVPLAQRDQTGVMMAVNSEQLGLARKEIQKFRRRIDKILSLKQKSKDEVYQLCISFFPLTTRY